MEIADLAGSLQHARKGKQVGVELRRMPAGDKLRLVIELPKQVCPADKRLSTVSAGTLGASVAVWHCLGLHT